jgi:hypothetical protein
VRHSAARQVRTSGPGGCAVGVGRRRARPSHLHGERNVSADADDHLRVGGLGLFERSKVGAQGRRQGFQIILAVGPVQPRPRRLDDLAVTFDGFGIPISDLFPIAVRDVVDEPQVCELWRGRIVVEELVGLSLDKDSEVAETHDGR